LGGWRGGEEKALVDWKYREKMVKYFFHIFLKSNFLENNKLMFMINIFLIL